MQIEEGKFYRTRDGRRVVPMSVWGDCTNHADGGALYHCPDFDNDEYWQANGINAEPGCNPTPALDLVALLSPTNNAPGSAGQNWAHTPGPWRVCGGYTPAYCSIHSESGYIVFGMADRSVHSEGAPRRPINAPDMETQRANARLIAAAPEVVEHAARVMALLAEHGPSIVPHLLDTDDNAGQRLRTALRKATGEGV